MRKSERESGTEGEGEEGETERRNRDRSYQTLAVTNKELISIDFIGY